VRLLENTPVEVVPSANLLSSIVTPLAIFHTVPFSVIAEPPSEVIFPPKVAVFTPVVFNMEDTVGFTMVGATELFDVVMVIF